MGKELELVREVERFQLDVVGLTSMHGQGSETSLVERSWTLFHFGVAQLGACTLEFTPVDKRVASHCLWVGG